MSATVVPGTLYPARPGARRHPVVVACPWCAEGHHNLHWIAVGADYEALHRRPRCAPRRVYRIAIAETLPAGVVA
jgi:hypothetical protein